MIKNAIADKTQETKLNAVASGFSQQQSKTPQSFDTEKGQLQKIANESVQVQQLKDYQAIADNYTSKNTQLSENVNENSRTDNSTTVQLNKLGAGIGAAIGGAIGAIGFLGGPVVGGITTSLGVGLGAYAGNWISGTELENLNAELAGHLNTAINTPKAGGVLAFENYVTTAGVGGYNQSNALTLLRMVWSLNQVSGFIVGSLAGKSPEDAAKILDSFIITCRNTINTERQPWGAGNHAEYIANPAYFQSLFSSPIDYLNANFVAMNPATRMNFLTSVNGWNHQKGPAQLAEDLLIQDYTPVVAPARIMKTMGNAEINKFMNVDLDPLEQVPPDGTEVVDFSSDHWILNSVDGGDFTLTPTP